MVFRLRQSMEEIGLMTQPQTRLLYYRFLDRGIELAKYKDKVYWYDYGATYRLFERDWLWLVSYINLPALKKLRAL